MNNLRDQIIARHAPCARRRAELEYDVICAVIRSCTRAGFALDSIASDDYTNVRTARAALELIFDLDECTLRFRRKGDKSGRLYGVLLVMGNDGWDVVSDHTWDGGSDVMKPEPGTFAAAVESATRPFADKYCG
jgi:hypothetical protein